MAVDIYVEYEGELHCSATHGPSGQKLVTDAPTDNGGKGEAFSPTDLVGTALGSCILTIMGLMAAKHDLDIRGTRVHVVKEMAAAPERRIQSLALTVTFPGGNALAPADRTRLEQAAKSCPVKASLHPDVAVTLEFIYP